MTKTKTKPDSSKMYVAWQGFAAMLPDGTQPIVQRGTRLKGSHPVVAHAFANFVPDGTPDDEIPSVFAGLGEDQK